MARAGSKRQIAIDIMNANADKSMAEVMAMISEANNIPLSAARGYYKYLCEQGMAAGKVEKIARQKAVSVAHVDGEPNKFKVTPAVVKTVKRVASETAKKAETKTPEEIEKIKAANLARLKKVHAKVKQNVKREENEVIEADPFSAPVALTMDEVNALV